MTTDEEEIRKIRALMLEDSSMKLKEAVDKSRKGMDAVREREKRD